LFEPISLSLLIVRCPTKPIVGASSALSGDAARGYLQAWQELGCAERFEWCLVDGDDKYETGTGTTESMPYADEVLVFMPTIDVRLIEAKVPLANAKKLQQILPNLIEEYVLSGAQLLSVQALPPVLGKPAVQRVIALIDRAWFAWLTKQLESLISQRVRLIPECFLLDIPAEDVKAVIAYQREDGNVILTQRTAQQLGVAWVERLAADAELENITLPNTLQGATVKAFEWEWLVPAAREYLQTTSSSRSANFALNLLPKTFRQKAGKGLANFSALLNRKSGRQAQAIQSGASWLDAAVWRQPLQWSKYLLVSIAIGCALHLTWLVVDNWRWGNQIEVLAAQSLTPNSVAKLNQAKELGVMADVGDGVGGTAPNAGNPSANRVIAAFITQVTNDQRRQGLVSDADFAPMAAKLQQLKAAFGAAFGPETLQKIDYDGYGIDFEFKPSALKLSNQQASDEVTQKARALGLMVKPLGPNRYRLEPYSGLGL
jgi:hypothetical protein